MKILIGTSSNMKTIISLSNQKLCRKKIHKSTDKSSKRKHKTNTCLIIKTA